MNDPPRATGVGLATAPKLKSVTYVSDAGKEYIFQITYDTTTEPEEYVATCEVATGTNRGTITASASSADLTFLIEDVMPNAVAAWEDDVQSDASLHE